MTASQIDHERTKYHKIIAKYYGSKYINEVASMLQVGYTGYCDEVMKAHYTCGNNIRRLLQCDT